MMKYKVIKFFMDGQDGNRSYVTGDIYPRDGLNPSEERIAELASKNNRLGEILIEPVQSTAQKKEEEKPAEAIEEQAAKPKKKKKSE